MCDCEILVAHAHVDLKDCSISAFAAFWKQYVWKYKTITKNNTNKNSYIVEAAIEFALNHSITVTWVEPACKTSQLLELLSCRKAGHRVN